MKKFNLRKQASIKDSVVLDKSLDKNRKDMNLSNEKQDVVGKNINLSLPIKDKDNTVPFNQQLEASRKNGKSDTIIEAEMSKEVVEFGSKAKKQVMDINVESRKHADELSSAYKKAEDSTKSDTEFWDKYVGVQLEGKMKKVDNNVPSSQLQNAQGRFKGDKIDKMVMASLKDADAMLFHIFATASSQDRELTADEKQQVIDINSGKKRIADRFAAKTVDPIIVDENGMSAVYDNNVKIDEFNTYAEAKANYPEGDSGNLLKNSQFSDNMGVDLNEDEVDPLDVDQKPVRYRVLIPIDIWAVPTGDKPTDQRNVYDMIMGIMQNGSDSVDHEGFNVLLQINDIKTHTETMKEFGL